MNAYIDWGYDAQRALGVISFTLTETGGGGATGTVTLSGQYLHTVEASAGTVAYADPSTGEQVFAFADTYAQMSGVLKAALDNIGAATYAVTFNAATRRYTISATGGGVTAFDLTSLSTGAVRYLGEPTLVSALVKVSSVDVWHFSYAENLGFSRWDMRDASPEGAETLMGADGSVRGLSPIGTARLLDFVVPSEPREAIRSDETQASYTPRGWTWHRAVYRCRSIEPAIIHPGDGSQAFVGYLRPDYTFAPRLKSADYLEVQDVPLSFHIVGEIA